MNALYKDASKSIDDRLADLLGRMTLAEKVGQMLQLDARGDIDEIVSEQTAGSILHASPETMLKAVELAANTRLGIPLITADDCIHGHSFWPGATIFPTQLAMACSWNADLLERAARVTAIEVAATGIHWTFSPVLCISRELRWGRVNETFGEDPYLLGELGAAMIRGYQGKGLSDPTAILATAKHFAGYSETQGGRDASEADISQRKLRSWFLPPFERAVEAGCRTFMLGYQAMDGVPITANKWLLNDVLKGEWGFKGTLVTDWDNVGRMVWEQKVVADYVQAAALAVKAGNDLVMTTPKFYRAAQDAVAQGLLEEAEIDAAVSRILRLKFELGLFENPRSPDAALQAQVIGIPEHRELNLEVARKSLVLLRNNGTLPIDAVATAKRIAVIGPNANDTQAVLGDWAGASGQVDWMPDGHPRETVETVLDGFVAVSPENWKVEYSRGAEIQKLVTHPLGETFPDGQPIPKIFSVPPKDPELLAQAVKLAADSDYAVCVLGDTIELTGEYRSTATLELQGNQIELLDALVATGTPVILVLVQSKPSNLPKSAESAAAIIQAFNPGMRGGRAIAELVFGLIEPSGRMPITVPRHVGQQPSFYNRVRGQHGDSYADLTQEPLFVFGEGLSYTTVEYSNLQIHTPQVGIDDEIQATVTLTNTGDRPALETVQVYVSDLVTSVTWADKELKHHVQVEVLEGQNVTVHLRLPANACTLVNAAAQRVVEPGEFELIVGPNSRTEDCLKQSFWIS